MAKTKNTLKSQPMWRSTPNDQVSSDDRGDRSIGKTAEDAQMQQRGVADDVDVRRAERSA